MCRMSLLLVWCVPTYTHRYYTCTKCVIEILKVFCVRIKKETHKTFKNVYTFYFMLTFARALYTAFIS